MKVFIVAWSLSNELVSVAVVSPLTGTHRDCLIVACFDQGPEIYSALPVSRDQIISTDLL